MTCIVGLVEGNTVWMGGDSAGLGGYDLTKEKHGHFQNAVGLKKPGATIAK